MMYFKIPSVRKYKDQYRHIQRIFENGFIDHYFSRLTSRERIVVQKRVGFCDNNPRSLREIGEQLGISQSRRVHQIEIKALIKIYKQKPTGTDYVQFIQCRRAKVKEMVLGLTRQLLL